VAGRNRILTLLGPIVLLAGCEMMAPLDPQPPQQDPVQVRLEELERRLDALERVLASGTLIDLTVQVDELQRETADIRGRTETLEYESGGTLDRQRDLYVDLDDRIRELERGTPSRPPAVGAGTVPGQLPVPAGDDRENYEAAFELLKQQQYAGAGVAFQQFLASFPDSQLADNAQYWLAEAYYVTDRFEDALIQFQIVISGYPRSRKIPDALLKIGYSNYELGRWDDARAALVQVRNAHAESTAARLADQRIKRMDDENH
jgi:tol-pal system protein YbgF